MVSGGSASKKKSASSSKDGSRRYAAVAEKGESVWKKEWSGFMSGVSLKTLRDGTNKVSIQSSKDLQREAERNDEDGAWGGGATFSYLFNSPSEKKAARKHKLAEVKKKKEGPTVSKHQLAIKEAENKGLKLEGMTRKERRKFLQLSVSAEEIDLAKKPSTELKPHELMDEKLAWYQQGPYPIDVISEKLVRRKAEKKGKQLGMRYNYLLPHPSWLAKRAQRRKESVLAPLGKRIIFDEEGLAMDPFSGQYVNLAHPSNTEASGSITLEASLDSLLVDPSRVASSTVRAVVKSKEAASIIKQANLSTNFLSNSLVKGKAEDMIMEE